MTNIYTTLTKAKELYDCSRFLAPIVSTDTLRQMDNKIVKVLSGIQIDHERKAALRAEFRDNPTLLMLVNRIPENNF